MLVIFHEIGEQGARRKSPTLPIREQGNFEQICQRKYVHFATLVVDKRGNVGGLYELNFIAQLIVGRYKIALGKLLNAHVRTIKVN